MKTSDKLKDIFQYLLAGIIVVGYLVLVGYMAIHEAPEKNSGVLNTLFGALTLAFGGVVNYFFGSNKESAAKTQMIYDSTPIGTASIIPSSDITISTTTTIFPVV